MNLPKREELLLRVVLALPNASRTGLAVEKAQTFLLLKRIKKHKT